MSLVFDQSWGKIRQRIPIKCLKYTSVQPVSKIKSDYHSIIIIYQWFVAENQWIWNIGPSFSGDPWFTFKETTANVLPLTLSNSCALYKCPVYHVLIWARVRISQKRNSMDHLYLDTTPTLEVLTEVLTPQGGAPGKHSSSKLLALCPICPRNAAPKQCNAQCAGTERTRSFCRASMEDNHSAVQSANKSHLDAMAWPENICTEGFTGK